MLSGARVGAAAFLWVLLGFSRGSARSPSGFILCAVCVLRGVPFEGFWGAGVVTFAFLLAVVLFVAGEVRVLCGGSGVLHASGGLGSGFLSQLSMVFLGVVRRCRLCGVRGTERTRSRRNEPEALT